MRQLYLGCNENYTRNTTAQKLTVKEKVAEAELASSSSLNNIELTLYAIQNYK